MMIMMMDRIIEWTVVVVACSGCLDHIRQLHRGPLRRGHGGHRCGRLRDQSESQWRAARLPRGIHAGECLLSASVICMMEMLRLVSRKWTPICRSVGQRRCNREASRPQNPINKSPNTCMKQGRRQDDDDCKVVSMLMMMSMMMIMVMMMNYKTSKHRENEYAIIQCCHKSRVHLVHTSFRRIRRSWDQSSTSPQVICFCRLFSAIISCLLLAGF